MIKLFKNLQFFAKITVNTTVGNVNAYDASNLERTGAMSSAMKTFYDTDLLENAREKMIFTQLGKKQFLPAGHGDSVEWRRWNTFDKALTPLVEGVIPSGQKFGQSAISVQVQQYGDYAAISDRLDLHAVDNVLLGASEEMGAAGGETADTLVRNELCTGTSVMYADTLEADGSLQGTPSFRFELEADNNRLTPDIVNKAFTFLRKQKAPFFEGNKYVAVIHPSVAYDLRSHPDWVEAHKYSAAQEIFNGEIGELHGVRFIETTAAPIFAGENLFGDTANLTVASYSGTDTTSMAQYGVTSPYLITVAETITAAQAQKMVGRRVYLYDTSASKLAETLEIVGVTVSTKKLWLASAPAVTPSGTSGSADTLWPGEGGNPMNGPCAVYGTLFFGKDAFGVVDPEGMSMEMIIKEASQIGGPLNQFSTVGYKFENATKILYQNRMVRVESCSAYSGVDEAN